jgi:hypothetical protein
MNSLHVWGPAFARPHPIRVLRVRLLHILWTVGHTEGSFVVVSRYAHMMRRRLVARVMPRAVVFERMIAHLEERTQNEPDHCCSKYDGTEEQPDARGAHLFGPAERPQERGEHNPQVPLLEVCARPTVSRGCGPSRLPDPLRQPVIAGQSSRT